MVGADFAADGALASHHLGQVERVQRRAVVLARQFLARAHQVVGRHHLAAVATHVVYFGRIS